MGTTTKNTVVDVKAPSYMSQIKTWNGKAPTLNNIEININITPTSKTNVSTESVKKFANVSKDNEPVVIYNIEIPKSSRHELKEPKMKYFIPDSTLNSELQKKVAKT